VAVSRGSGSGRIARAVADNGTTGIVIMTVAVWAGGVVLSSALWWAGIRRARRQR
jgi:hypothetical protein